MTEPDLLLVLRQKHLDATEREADLLDMLISIYPFIPPNLFNLRTGLATSERIATWVKNTYGLNLTIKEKRDEL